MFESCHVMSYWEERGYDAGREFDPLIASLQAPPRNRIRRGSGAARLRDFNEQLRSLIAPQFRQMESDLTMSVDQLQSHLNELERLHNQTREFVEQFQNQIDLSKENFDVQWTRLSDWDNGHENVIDMRNRVKKLQENLTESKKRLLKLDQVIKLAGREASQRERQLQLWGRISLALTVLVIGIGLKFFI